MIEAYAVVLHFTFNGEDVSVYPRGPRMAYATKAQCDPHAAVERLKWRDKWVKPTKVVCEKLEIR